jgi:hypothetical protein
MHDDWPSLWLLALASVAGAAGFFGLFWAVWVIGLALGLVP